MCLQQPEAAALARCYSNRWSKNQNAVESGPFRPVSFQRTSPALPYTSPAAFAKSDAGIVSGSCTASGAMFFCWNAAAQRSVFNNSENYFPTTSTTKLSGRIVCRGWGLSALGGGGGPNFAVTTNTW